MAKKGKKRKAAAGDLATNRKAGHKYDLLEKIECGIVLVGSEVKSIRAGKVQLKDGYAAIDNGELWLHNVHVAPYPPASHDNHEPERTRKLLIKRGELDRLIGKMNEKGLTLVPTRIYLSGSRVKVELGLGKGKTMHDKRRTIRDKEMDRDMDREIGRRR